MTGNQDQAAMLMAFIEDLPEKELRKLAATIELDRGDNRLGLPHNAVMAMLRPSLALIRAPRALIPQRAFCLPFEDMLVNGRTGPKADGRIDRSSIIPMWNWLTGELDPPDLEAACARYLAAQKNSDDQAITDLSAELWRIGAAALSAGLGDCQGERAEKMLADKLGGEEILADIREMSAVLQIAQPLEKLKQGLPPKPMVDLKADQLSRIREAYNNSEEDHPREAVYILVAIMARLLRPFPILKVMKDIARSGDDFMLQRTDMAIPGNIAMDGLEEDAAAVVGACEDREVADMQVIQKARYFAEGFRTITESIGIKRDGEWGQRMHACRGNVSENLTRRLFWEARKIIAKAIPARDGGTSPKLSDPPDLTLYEQAEARAQALGALNYFADQVGLKSECRKHITESQKDIEIYADALLRVLPKSPDEKKPLAQGYLHIAVRLMEVLISADEADSLRKRGTMALDLDKG